MMKKIITIISILLATLLLTSCGLTRPKPVPLPMPANEGRTLPEGGDPSVNLPADGEPQGIWNNVIDFEAVEMDALPESVRAWADEASQSAEKVADRMDDGEYTYILVGLGEKPSAGYGVEVVSIEDPEAGKYAITVKTTEPGEDSMNADVITYPAIVVRIAKTNIDFIFVNEDGTNFIEK